MDECSGLEQQPKLIYRYQKVITTIHLNLRKCSACHDIVSSPGLVWWRIVNPVTSSAYHGLWEPAMWSDPLYRPLLKVGERRITSEEWRADDERIMTNSQSNNDEVVVMANIHTYIHTHAHTHLHTHAHTRAHTHTYTHTRIHTYIHTHISIQSYIASRYHFTRPGTPTRTLILWFRLEKIDACRKRQRTFNWDRINICEPHDA